MLFFIPKTLNIFNSEFRRYKLKIYLKGGERRKERARGRGREIYLLVHSWARLKPRAWNPIDVFHVSTRDPNIWAKPCCLPGCMPASSWIRKQGTWWGHPKQHLNCCAKCLPSPRIWKPQNVPVSCNHSQHQVTSSQSSPWCWLSVGYCSSSPSSQRAQLRVLSLAGSSLCSSSSAAGTCSPGSCRGVIVIIWR